MTTDRLTLKELNDSLWANIRRLESGEVTPSIANSIVANAATILRGAKEQMAYAKATNRTPVVALFEMKD